MNIKIEHQNAADLLRAMAHPIRFCIIEGLLMAERDVSTMVTCLDEPQPKISQHLNVLKAAGVIEGHRDGTRIIYSIKNEDARKIVKAIGSSHLWEKIGKAEKAA